MNGDVDRLIIEGLVPMKKRAVESFARNHPHLMALLKSYLGGKKNRVGILVTENGKTAGEYTIHPVSAIRKYLPDRTLKFM